MNPERDEKNVGVAASSGAESANGMPQVQARRPRSKSGAALAASNAAPRERERAEVLQRYKSFFDAHAIRDVDREKIASAKVAYTHDLIDTILSSRSQGLSIDQTQELTCGVTMRFNEIVADTIGSEAGRELADYESVLRFSPVAETFAAQCAANGMPLSDEAVAALMGTFSGNTLDPSTPTAKTKAADDYRARHDEVAFQEAAKVLSPAQLEAFKKYWSEGPYPSP